MIKKISTRDLKAGMQVAKLASGLWEHHPSLYLVPGLIVDEAHAQTIRDHGFLEVFVDTEQGTYPWVDEPAMDAALKGAAGRASKSTVPFEQEFRAAGKVYRQTMDMAKQLLHDVRLGRQLEYSAAAPAISAIADSAIRNPDALHCLCKISRHDSYTYTHSVNVAVLAVIFGAFAGLDKDELFDLGAAGLFHDLGKTRIPKILLRKRGPLTPDEFQRLKCHSTFGHECLLAVPGVPRRVLEGVLTHHEKYNGNGYPNGLKGQEIGLFGRILGLVDVYDALTSDRPYKQALLPNEALSILYGMREQDFAAPEVELFIKCLGIYPSGSFVRLTTGECGIVLENRPDKPLRPRVKLLSARGGRMDGIPLLDLADPAAPVRGVSIAEALNPRLYAVDLNTLLNDAFAN